MKYYFLLPTLFDLQMIFGKCHEKALQEWPLDTADAIIEKEKNIYTDKCLLSSRSFSAFSFPLFLSSILFFCPGSKAPPRLGGIGSAAGGPPGIEGDSVLSKILPGGAAEQAGKLGEGTRNTWLYSTL